VIVLLCALAVIEHASPFLEEFQWKRAGKVGTLLLSAMAVCLNMVAALDQNQAMQVRFGRQLEAAAIGLTYVVGIGSIGCIVLLFALFWWTLLQEDTEGPEAIRRETTARDVRRASLAMALGPIPRTKAALL